MEQQTQPMNQTTQQPMKEKAKKVSGPNKKKSKLMGFIILLILIGIGVGVYFFIIR